MLKPGRNVNAPKLTKNFINDPNLMMIFTTDLLGWLYFLSCSIVLIIYYFRFVMWWELQKLLLKTFKNLKILLNTHKLFAVLSKKIYVKYSRIQNTEAETVRKHVVVDWLAFVIFARIKIKCTMWEQAHQEHWWKPFYEQVHITLLFI